MSPIALVLVPVSYVLGNFASAAMVARAAGVDISTQGSGNPGASNVSRVLGWKAGLLVFALDAAKGAAATGLGWALDGRPAAYLCAAAATLGHMFPVIRSSAARFKGGKGVATVGGAMIVLHPLISIALGAVWFAVSKLTRKASLASIVIAVLLPVGIALTTDDRWEVLAALALAALVMIRHANNIKRLIRKEELTLDQHR